MKRRITIAVFIIALAYLQLETAVLLEWLYPKWSAKQIHPFLDKDYVFPGTLNIKWWIKLNCNDLKNLIVMFTAAWALFPFSRKLGFCFMCYGLYHLTDCFMLWYNYRTSEWVYIAENGFNILSLFMLAVPERKGAKIKSFV